MRAVSSCISGAATHRPAATGRIIGVWTSAQYLLSLNLPFAMLVGGVLVVVGLVLLRFLMATTSEVGRMVPGAGDAAGRAILDARDMPPDSWVCTAAVGEHAARHALLSRLRAPRRPGRTAPDGSLDPGRSPEREAHPLATRPRRTTV